MLQAAVQAAASRALSPNMMLALHRSAQNAEVFDRLEHGSSEVA